MRFSVDDHRDDRSVPLHPHPAGAHRRLRARMEREVAREPRGVRLQSLVRRLVGGWGVEGVEGGEKGGRGWGGRRG